MKLKAMLRWKLPKTMQENSKLKEAIRKGILLRSEGRFLEALNYMESIRGFFDDGPYLRHFYCGLGRTYRLLGRAEDAIAEYEKAHKVSITDESDHMDIAAIESNIANAKLDLSLAQDALNWLACAEEYFREKKDDHWLGEILETKARAYLQLGHQDLAEQAAQESYDLLKHYFDTPALERARETLRTAMSRVGVRV